MSEMMDKIKDILEKAGADTSSFREKIDYPEDEPMPPLEESLMVAMYALEEIKIYAQLGRTAECGREATEALDKLKELATTWQEQERVMDALTKPVEEAGHEV